MAGQLQTSVSNGRKFVIASDEWPQIVAIGTVTISLTEISVSLVRYLSSSHLHHFLIFLQGHWSQEEEEQLTRIVTDMTVKQGKDIDNDVFWGKVSELMGGKRGRQQCRIKWSVLSFFFSLSISMNLPFDLKDGCFEQDC
jgi:hypothetical protein